MTGMRRLAMVTAACVLVLASIVGAADPIRVTVAARADQPGELLVLTLTTAIRADTVSVRAFDRDTTAFQVDPSTWRALVGIDLETRPGSYVVSVSAKSGRLTEHAATTIVVTGRSFPTRRLKVDPAFVSPPPDVQRRIAQEAEDLARVWRQSAPGPLWSEAFVPPVPGAATSAFGSRSIFNGQLRSPHSGGDFLSPLGTPVEAPNSGRVVMARELYFTGNVVVIDHGLSLFSLLAHLSAIDVREGDTVTAGQRVGLVGATGRVTGPHLHWAVRVGGARVDPLSLLATLGRNAATDATPPPTR